MSEYQYYEFQAIDRPLTAKEMGELRSYSTRARITPTSFVNEYSWGRLQGRRGSVDGEVLRRVPLPRQLGHPRPEAAAAWSPSGRGRARLYCTGDTPPSARRLAR